MTLPLLPGAVGFTHLRVYDTPGPDGLPGGSPHFHLVCTEAYVVQQGHGVVQTLDATGFAEHELSPGRVVWFSPGVIHRLINRSHDLEILVVMQNAGLPEAGDFVLTFPEHVLRDPAAYAEASALARGDFVYARGLEAAQRRRDLAVQGFAEWKQRFDVDGPAALEVLYRAATTLALKRLPHWRELVQRGPAAAVAATQIQLESLARGDAAHLAHGRVAEMNAPAPGTPGTDRPLGMCGTLGLYTPEGVTVS